ncbi:hypothetical protein ACTMU2_31665 [Cupriavidus basilensis]
MLMTVSPPGHEHYFEKLAELAAQEATATCKPLARCEEARYDTDQLSALTARS